MVGLILTNYGLRLVERSREQLPLLSELREKKLLPLDGSERQRQLIAQGLAQASELDLNQVALRYRRNPLEHLSRVVLEYTTVCNFRCLHCRNAFLPAVTEGRPEALCQAADLLVPLELRRFDFIGGEVTRFGTGWLDVVRHIRRHPETVVSVLSNGWFLEQEGFVAAGERYRDESQYLCALRDAGVTHLTFSIDGPRSVHDRWRSSPGLYRRILSAFDRVVQAGLTPQVSLVVNSPELNSPAWLIEIARALYGFAPDADPEEPLAQLLRDPMNYVSNFIDIGGGASMRHEQHPVEISETLLRCKNFFRPQPSLRIQASGELSLCPLADSGEGYGNLHREPGMLASLNRMQDAFVYRLHAEKQLGTWRRFLDRELFGDRFGHLCSLRAVLAMIARRMHERAVAEDDKETIRAINLEVAQRTGFAPA